MPAKCTCGCGHRVRLKGMYRKGHNLQGGECDPEGKAKSYMQSYQKTEKAKVVQAAARKKYRASEKGKVTMKRYIASEQRKASRKKYVASEKSKAAQDRYNFSEKGRKKRKLYQQQYQPQLKAKRKKARLEKFQEYLKDHPCEEALLSEDDASSLANTIVCDENFPATDEQGSFYIGYTRRLVKEEELGWITTRGYAPVGKDGQRDYTKRRKTKPILQWADGTNITMKQAREILGFRSITVFQSKLKYNARMVEDALQMKFMRLKKGHRRLWRCVDKGVKYDGPEDANHVHTVFVCFSTAVQTAIDARKIKINK